MAKPKGSPKTGGRQKGTPNKRTQLAAQILEEQGFCPLLKGIALYNQALREFKKGRGDFRFKYLEIAQRELQDLRQYVYPKRKAIDITSDGQALSFSDLMAKAAALEKKA